MIEDRYSSWSACLLFFIVSQRTEYCYRNKHILAYIQQVGNWELYSYTEAM